MSWPWGRALDQTQAPPLRSSQPGHGPDPQHQRLDGLARRPEGQRVRKSFRPSSGPWEAESLGGKRSGEKVGEELVFVKHLFAKYHAESEPNIHTLDPFQGRGY